MEQSSHYPFYTVTLINSLSSGNNNFPLGFKEHSMTEKKNNPILQAPVSIWWPDSNTAASDLPED